MGGNQNKLNEFENIQMNQFEFSMFGLYQYNMFYINDKNGNKFYSSNDIIPHSLGNFFN
mgnify:CR=1 FL=1